MRHGLGTRLRSQTGGLKSLLASRARFSDVQEPRVSNPKSQTTRGYTVQELLNPLDSRSPSRSLLLPLPSSPDRTTTPRSFDAAAAAPRARPSRYRTSRLVGAHAADADFMMFCGCSWSPSFLRGKENPPTTRATESELGALVGRDGVVLRGSESVLPTSSNDHRRLAAVPRV
ncbi:hypothetical protein B0H11DRAFT_278676 [Mycena galericulata]|nr:hypothetical protein B0H11DRAFT_278676 [Mycena galericulata]